MAVEHSVDRLRDHPPGYVCDTGVKGGATLSRAVRGIPRTLSTRISHLAANLGSGLAGNGLMGSVGLLGCGGPLAESPERLENKTESKSILLWGSSRSGKTSILYRWKLGVAIPTVDTVGLLEERFTAHKTIASAHSFRSRSFDAQSFDVQSGDARCPGMVAASMAMASVATTASTITDGDSVVDEVSYQFERRRAASAGARTSVEVKVCEVGRDPTSLEIAVRDSPSGEEHEEAWALHFLNSVCCGCCSSNQRRFGYETFFRLWAEAVATSDAVVYVVDCASAKALQEVAGDATLVMNHEGLRRKGAKVLLLANKQDVCGALAAHQVEEIVGSDVVRSDRFKILPTSAITGENIQEALQWIIQ
ncbi:ADP-ribosylation factor family protein [Gregarina niphandrodes]|uniref:ADP-ribosylation factor family protein n=1 Tax=Gregarina niphandrodes TaxID=110365 RepID=A0A023B2A0_GRENI|nr:ADP-ribosylation factor family protein [Gregarina niphandrodes]EZG51581.1 ADP-ribosylation factor family protein [Gregarina niphandrodes]|eukprot:XP_011131941.1 ADP-ribosylation factor family protein [Gregarina niphandrodes]